MGIFVWINTKAVVSWRFGRLPWHTMLLKLSTKILLCARGLAVNALSPIYPYWMRTPTINLINLINLITSYSCTVLSPKRRNTSKNKKLTWIVNCFPDLDTKERTCIYVFQMSLLLDNRVAADLWYVPHGCVTNLMLLPACMMYVWLWMYCWQECFAVGKKDAWQGCVFYTGFFFCL